MFADELLNLARGIASLNGNNPRQANVRRAVSTAYYALFHFIVGEATANWSQPEFRPLLGRVFEHGKIRQACDQVTGGLLEVPAFENRSTPEDHLKAVARRFIQAQELRETADYEVDGQWRREDAETQIDQVQDRLQELGGHSRDAEGAGNSGIAALAEAREAFGLNIAKCPCRGKSGCATASNRSLALLW
jgi:hypothetical protein